MIEEEKLGEGEDDAYSIDHAHSNRQEFSSKDQLQKLKQIRSMRESKMKYVSLNNAIDQHIENSYSTRARYKQKPRISD